MTDVFWACQKTIQSNLNVIFKQLRAVHKLSVDFAENKMAVKQVNDLVISWQVKKKKLSTFYK